MPLLPALLAVPVLAILAVVITRAVSEPSATASRPSRDGITIANFAFMPDTLTVDRGARIRVGNTDGVTHTLTAQDGSFDTGDLRGGASRTITLDRPGHFTYRCRIHDYMTGEVTVR